MTTFALHGFLGRPSDFSDLGLSLQAVDYLKTRELSSMHDFKTWAQNWNQFVEAQTPNETQRWLIGYSQGGRLALHAVKQNPRLWSGLVLISTNPGIPLWERSFRLASDQEWAQNFETKDFSKVLEQWNSQPVFKGGQAEPRRLEEDYNVHLLAKCLTQWSLGLQEDFHDFLATTTIPLAYVSGENDPKYLEIGQNLKKANPRIHLFSVENSGHRVLFDQPQILGSLIRQFQSSLREDGP